jgi:hypothetical protein
MQQQFNADLKTRIAGGRTLRTAKRCTIIHADGIRLVLFTRWGFGGRWPTRADRLLRRTLNRSVAAHHGAALFKQINKV